MWIESFLFGAVIDGGFIFLKENTPPLDRHTSVPVPVPVGLLFDGFVDHGSAS
jgi:hypothetical protein